MTKLTVTGTLATTRAIDKYGGVQIPLDTLERMRDQIDSRSVPLQMNHSVLNSLDGNIVDVRIAQISEDEHALLVDFEVEEAIWSAVEAEWQAAGVPGGFSAALTQLQETVPGPSGPPVTLVSDAGAYSDSDRANAAQRISQLAPVEVLRLFQFSEPEFAKIVLEFGREVAAAGLVAAVSYLVGQSHGRSHVELKRAEADGSVTTAVIETDDPEIVRAAAESFDAKGAPPDSRVFVFDDAGNEWETSALGEAVWETKSDPPPVDEGAGPPS